MEPKPEQGKPIKPEELGGTKEMPVVGDLLNPYKYALEHVHIKPELAGKRLGFVTKRLDNGVVRVSTVELATIAEQFGIEVGWFLLSCNGRQATGEEDDLKPSKDGLRMSFARRRSAEFDVTVPNQFLGQYHPKVNCEYAMLRLDMTKCKLAALNLIAEADRHVHIGPAADQQALKEFGLRVGDAVLRINGVPVKDRSVLDAVTSAGHDWIDVVIERPRADMPKQSPSPMPDELPDYEFEVENTEGLDPPAAAEWEEVMDPSTGVPSHVPPDVVKIVMAPNLPGKVVSKKKSSTKTKSVRKKAAASGNQAKVDKQVDKTKLAKPTTSSDSKEENF